MALTQASSSTAWPATCTWTGQEKHKSLVDAYPFLGFLLHSAAFDFLPRCPEAVADHKARIWASWGASRACCQAPDAWPPTATACPVDDWLRWSWPPTRMSIRTPSQLWQMSTAIPRWKYRFSSDHRSQATSGEVSTWMGDRLGILRAVDFFCSSSSPSDWMLQRS